jgi:hypothetical protein
MTSNPHLAAEFPQTVSDALGQLKCELQRDYERAYPALRQIIHLVLEEEEINAWSLSPFPHLIFPDLVEAHIARLNLLPVGSHHHTAKESRERTPFPIYQPAFA